MDAKPSSQLSPPVMLMLSYFSEAIDTTVLFHLQRESRDQPAVCCPSVYWQQVMIYARHLFGQLLISKQSNQNAEFALLWEETKRKTIHTENKHSLPTSLWGQEFLEKHDVMYHLPGTAPENKYSL